MNMISMKEIPQNRREMERLATFAALEQDKQKKKKNAAKDQIRSRLQMQKQKTMLGIGGG